MEIVKTGARHVHHGRGEHMGVRQGALWRERGLCTLLEAATVRYAAENARNKLRVVDITEAVEQLVLRVEVEVHPGIKRVAELGQLGRVSKIVKETAACGRGIQIQQFNGIRIQPVQRQLIKGAVGKTVSRSAGRA